MTPGPLLTAWARRTGQDPARLLAEALERNRLWRAAACRANQASFAVVSDQSSVISQGKLAIEVVAAVEALRPRSKT